MLPAPSALGVEVWNLVQEDLVALILCFLEEEHNSSSSVATHLLGRSDPDPNLSHACLGEDKAWRTSTPSFQDLLGRQEACGIKGVGAKCGEGQCQPGRIVTCGIKILWEKSQSK